MSLDQFGSGARSNYAALYNSLDDENMSPFAITRASFRRRGHTLSSSYSSNHGRKESMDDSSSRYSSHPSKGRRSNSSSNVPLTSARSGAPPLSTHGRAGTGRTGSKSSGSSSVDYGYSQVLGTSKWGTHSAHRSASVDNIYDSAKGSSPAQQKSTVMDRGRPVPLDLWDGEDEAAPEPLVRSGPVRQSQYGLPLRLPPHSSHGPHSTIENNRSSQRNLYHSPTADSHIPESIRRQASDFVTASTMTPEILSPDPVAPAPAISYRKASDGPHSSGLHAGTPKERPGFFRRVFGSSKNSSNSLNPRHSVLSDDSNNGDREENNVSKTNTNHNHIASQLKTDTVSSPLNMTGDAEPQRPSLQKKPSSFFRRRKRSVTDARPPPSLPTKFITPTQSLLQSAQPAQPSPSISSLRKVMTPWLNGGQVTPSEATFDPRQTVRVENDDTIYMDNPYPEHAKHHAKQPSASSAASLRMGKLQTTSEPKPNEFEMAEQKIKTSLMRYDQGDTFLADNSDIEEKPRLGHEPMKMQTKTKEASEAKSSQTNSLHSYSTRKAHQNSERRPPLVFKELTKKASLASQATSPQSVETARTHWDSTGELSPADDETYVVANQERDTHAYSSDSNHSQRLWLNPTKSEEKLEPMSSNHLTLPLEGSRSSARGPSLSSEADDKLSASVPNVESKLGDTDQDAALSISATATTTPFGEMDEPTEEDKKRAEQIFNGNETFVTKSEAAAWLGDKEAVNLRTRKAYMELFNLTDLNVLAAMRDFCNRLILKGETQQIDRLLHAFSRRWCACNPNHGFKDFGRNHRWTLAMFIELTSVRCYTHYLVLYLAA